MSFNYNFNDAPDYDLNASLIDEVINLYGVLVKFLKVQHINTDDIVFKDYSSKIYKQYFNPLTPFIDSSIKHLYISPTGQLNDFPFELLVMKNSKINNYNYSDFLTLYHCHFQRDNMYHHKL